MHADKLNSPLFELAHLTTLHLESLPAGGEHDGLRAAFMDDLRGASNCQVNPAPAPGRSVRGLRHAASVFAQKPAAALCSLFDAARAAFGHVRWSEFYEEDDWSKGFLPEFANGEGIGPDGNLISEKTILGLFMLGPETLYPPHAHPAEEFYLILSGDPAFQIGAGSAFETLRAGEVAWHQSNVSHGIQTGRQPMFAVFGWRGAINEPSWYRENMIDECLPLRYPSISKS